MLTAVKTTAGSVLSPSGAGVALKAHEDNHANKRKFLCLDEYDGVRSLVICDDAHKQDKKMAWYTVWITTQVVGFHVGRRKFGLQADAGA